MPMPVLVPVWVVLPFIRRRQKKQAWEDFVGKQIFENLLWGSRRGSQVSLRLRNFQAHIASGTLCTSARQFAFCLVNKLRCVYARLSVGPFEPANSPCACSPAQPALCHEWSLSVCKLFQCAIASLSVRLSDCLNVWLCVSDKWRHMFSETLGSGAGTMRPTGN